MDECKPLAAGIEAEDAAVVSSPARPPGLVVVATLVDKIPNLAGLARTCEVLGAEALTIADARVTKHHDFCSISVRRCRLTPG